MYETGHLCWRSFFLKAVHSFDSNETSSFAESRGGPYVSGGRSILVAFIHKIMGVMLVRIILQT